MNRFLIACLFVALLFGCNEEAYESDSAGSGNNSQNVIPNFLTINTGGYWIYDVQNSNQEFPEINLASQDSIYVTSTNGNIFTLGANNGTMANGNMNGLLTNGTLTNAVNSLTFNGSLELLEIFSNLGLSNNLELSELVLINLEANNEEVIFTQDSDLSENLLFDGTEIPIEINITLTTTRVNFHDSIMLNGENYSNVFEGKLVLSASVTGTFDFGLSNPQTIPILESQNIIETTYFFSKNIGLVRSHTLQGFSLSVQLTNLLGLINIPLDFPTSIMQENVEELRNYFIG